MYRHHPFSSAGKFQLNSPCVSVVIPAHNAAATLRATLYSVLQQSFSDLEVLVVDDGSTDNTYSVAGTVDDARLRVIQQSNLGASGARNTGIKAATGEYIAFLDADDLWHRNKLDRQYGFMSRQGASASQTAVWFIDNDLTPLHRGSCPPFRDPLLDVLLFRHLPAFPSTLMVERKLLDQIGLFDESLVILEDWEFAIRLARYGRFLNLDEALTMYRVHPGNRSRDLQLHIAPGFQVLDRLFSDPELPVRIRRQRAKAYAAMFVMYSGGALRSGNFRESVRWGMRAIKQHPSSLFRIAAMPTRRMRRRISRLRGGHTASDWTHLPT